MTDERMTQGDVRLREELGEWRQNRERGWTNDPGYAFQDVVRQHRYDYRNKGSKPADPGWHVCSCGGWEGYWSGFEPHVADHLRATHERIVAARVGEVVERVEAVLDYWRRGLLNHLDQPGLDDALRAALRAADAPVPTVGTSTPEPEQ
jgi:hypothetical protein